MFEVVTTPLPSEIPTPTEVRELYAAASAEPPLNEDETSADLFASVYAAALRDEQIVAALVRNAGRLVALAYGHPWVWEEQRYAWADELRACLGDNADLLDGTYSLVLLARDPEVRGQGFGTATLDAWFAQINGAATWLQTTDADTPARHLYTKFGFVPFGHGPSAPNGEPGLVMFRSTADTDLSGAR